MNKIILLIFLITIITGCKPNNSDKKESTKDYSKFESGLNIKENNDSLMQSGQSIQERLEHHKVPGASVAIFENGEIIWRKEYGVLKSNFDDKVNFDTKFQAASISKAVGALGVLKLVEQFDLDIDADINQYLKKWKVDYSQFPDTQKVTIRRLMSHSAGINVDGFYGYSKSSTIPSNLQILNGNGNNAKVQIDTIPGTKFLYSGGGYSILERLVEDVSEISFSEFLENEIFEPLKMKHSTYDLFPVDNIAHAHDRQGDIHPEGWLIYPELAAAGLWTTPTDIAKFCIAIENSFYNNENSIISMAYAKEMLRPTIEWRRGIWWGAGVALKGENEEVFYWHSGSNPGGYRCMMIDFYKKRSGIVVMTNSDNGAALYNEILDSYFNFKGIKL